ncbi:competence/damage-inducible protein A [Halobacterium sp. KA-6]|uniref:competence/damage-inducible protein A n=1 Tax=Halobacterium sp. KA-6 TaxID=2896368 RepID=UPI001E2FD02E|nr:molybdopterin-binding protein [Halobacterium sp. KA-6]MCD2202406.1 competence/damage-inducible protein A [Halobacterium sp. KA-6]
MQVAVVTVGDELLVGDTENTNASWLGARLTERGATVERVVVVPDERDAIASEVGSLADRYDAVVVTGGVGPTHDDVTMDGVAAAFDREMVEHADAVSYFQTHDTYQFADLTDGTAALPENARLLENEVGVAPGAVVENAYVFPGVPAEMKAMFESVADEFTGTTNHVEFVHVDAPESSLVTPLEELQAEFGVTVGSYPGDGVRVKIQHENEQTVHDAAAWLRERV